VGAVEKKGGATGPKIPPVAVRDRISREMFEL